MVTGTRVLLYPKLSTSIKKCSEYILLLRVHNRALNFELVSQSKTLRTFSRKKSIFRNHWTAHTCCHAINADYKQETNCWIGIFCLKWPSVCFFKKQHLTFCYLFVAILTSDVHCLLTRRKFPLGGLQLFCVWGR